MGRREFSEQAYRSCLGIIRLAKRFPAERLNAARARALAYRILTHRGVINILLKNLDQQEPEKITHSPRGHENIRGAAYYGGEVSMH
jgi:hypothetical protein